MGEKRSLLYNSLIVYFIALVIFVGVRISVVVIDFPFDDTTLEYVSSAFVQIGIMFLLPIFVFSYFQRQKVRVTFESFRFKKVTIFTILLCVLIGLFCYFLNISVASFFGSIIRLFGFEDAPSLYSSSDDYSIGSFVLQVVFVALLPAVCEETMHRGLLLKGFSSLGIKLAVVLSSVLFGLMHMNVNQFFYTTILGFIIALSVIISNSIIPAMIIHFMNNFLSIYFSFALVHDWVGVGIYRYFRNFLSADNLIAYFFTSFFALAVILAIIVVLFIFLLKETRIKKVRNMLTDIATINKEFNTNTVLSGDANVSNLYNLNALMGEYNINGLSKMVFTEVESKKNKPSTKELVLLIACFVIGGLVTAFTFIWGML